MRKIFYITILLASILVGPSIKGLNSAFAQDLTEMETLGKLIFFDQNLSVNRRQSCANCHEPLAGFTGPDIDINMHGAVEPGAVPERFGNRKPPTAAYSGDSPVLYYNENYDNGTVLMHQDGNTYPVTNVPGSWIGGMFWDGRAAGVLLGDPLTEQAMGPFQNPLEMAMPDARLVCLRVAHSNYAGLFELVWGTGSLDYKHDVEGTYERIANSVAAYERSPELNPFSSKFDMFWRNATAAGLDITKITAAGIPMGPGPGGGGMGSGPGGGGMGPGGGGSPENNPARWQYYKNLGLTDEELKGLAVFNDSSRGNCASCHSLAATSQQGPPLFTDFSYHNLGIPKNPENPFYAMPKKWNPEGENWVDYGLGDYLKKASYPQDVSEPEMGKFKTPTLRNVDLRPYPEFVKAYGHNGFFKSLDAMDGIIHFYAWRAMMDTGTRFGQMGPNPNMFPPPEFDQNRIIMQPFNFMGDGARIMSFLKALSDGYADRMETQ